MLGKQSSTKRAPVSALVLLLTASAIAFSFSMLVAQNTSRPNAPSSGKAELHPAQSFDIANIKPNPSTEPTSWMGIRNTPEGIEAEFVTIPMLIQRAYGLRSTDQVTGGPEWTKNERFDIQAKMGEADMAALRELSAAETKARREVMLQALLAERFNLKVHLEEKQAPVFDLVIAKGGPRLQNAASDPNPPLVRTEDGKPRVGFNQVTKGTMVAQGETTKALADFLSLPTSRLERPLIDKTGLPGRYDFTTSLPLTHYSPNMGGDAADSPVPKTFDAVKALGLKLVSAKELTGGLILEHIEKPPGN